MSIVLRLIKCDKKCDKEWHMQANDGCKDFTGNTVPGTEFRELHFLLVVPWKVFPEQIIVEVLGPQRAYRPEISRQGCLQGCGCGGRRQYYCFRFNMNLVIHPIETPPRLLAGRGGGAFSRSLKPGPGPRPRAWLGAPDLLYTILRLGHQGISSSK